MRTDIINQVVRAVVLVLLLAYFAISLAKGLIEDERQKGFGKLHPGAGQDPGVRVLLNNRQPPEPIATWDKIDLAILQTVDIVSPNLPDDPTYHLTLHGGTLRIQPDTNTGLLLTAKEWGKDYTWPVSVVRIQPADTDPDAPPLGDKGQRPSPARRDPSLFEAVGRSAVFALASCRYRGALEVQWHSAKDLEAINCLPMEAYIEGVVAVEMSPGYRLQALKAQAIASRSYAYAHEIMARAAAREYDLTDMGEDQEYRGAGKGNDAVYTATFDTRGLIMVVDHTLPFAPLFCASSGGYTESIDAVLPGATDVRGHVPLNVVMKSQQDRFCQIGAEGLGDTSTHWITTTVIKSADLRLRLAKLYAPEGRSVGWIRNLRAGKRDIKSGRVLSVLIFHTDSSEPIEMSANSFRLLIGPNILRSTLWSSDSPQKRELNDGKRTITFEITSTGFGHGVGMSQVSAWEMANENYSAAEILRNFYHDIDFVTAW